MESRASLDTLPREILAMIFELVLDDDNDRPVPDVPPPAEEKIRNDDDNMVVHRSSAPYGITGAALLQTSKHLRAEMLAYIEWWKPRHQVHFKAVLVYEDEKSLHPVWISVPVKAMYYDCMDLEILIRGEFRPRARFRIPFPPEPAARYIIGVISGEFASRFRAGVVNIHIHPPPQHLEDDSLVADQINFGRETPGSAGIISAEELAAALRFEINTVFDALHCSSSGYYTNEWTPELEHQPVGTAKDVEKQNKKTAELLMSKFDRLTMSIWQGDWASWNLVRLREQVEAVKEGKGESR